MHYSVWKVSDPERTASALPQGPDLLRRAERRAAEKWEANGTVAEIDSATSG